MNHIDPEVAEKHKPNISPDVEDTSEDVTSLSIDTVPNDIDGYLYQILV